MKTRAYEVNYVLRLRQSALGTNDVVCAALQFPNSESAATRCGVYFMHDSWQQHALAREELVTCLFCVVQGLKG